MLSSKRCHRYRGAGSTDGMLGLGFAPLGEAVREGCECPSPESTRGCVWVAELRRDFESPQQDCCGGALLREPEASHGADRDQFRFREHLCAGAERMLAAESTETAR